MEWLDELPEQLRASPFISKAESLEDAVAKIQHAADYMGRAVKFPTEDSTPEDRAAFTAKVLENAPDLVQLPADYDDQAAVAAFKLRFGVPEESKDYAPADVENWDWDDEYVNNLRGMAQAAGLNKNQFKQFTKELATSGVSQEELRLSDLTAAKSEIKKEWGETYDERMTLMAGWLELSDAPGDLKDMVKEGNLTSDTANWLYSVAKQFTGDVKNLTSDEDHGKGTLTPMQGTEKVAEILADPAYFNVADPRHKMLKQRMFEAQTAVAAGQN